MPYVGPNCNNLSLLILGYILPGKFVAYWDFLYVPVQSQYVLTRQTFWLKTLHKKRLVPRVPSQKIFNIWTT